MKFLSYHLKFSSQFLYLMDNIPFYHFQAYHLYNSWTYPDNFMSWRYGSLSNLTSRFLYNAFIHSLNTNQSVIADIAGL